jgi:hypothetical protein
MAVPHEDLAGMIQINQKTLGRIWLLVRQAGMSKSDFYDILNDNYGKRHLHELTYDQIGQVMNSLARVRPSGARISPGQEEIIRKLAGKLVRDPENLQNYILAVCRDVAKKEGLRACESDDARKIIEALKAACRRKNV